MGSSVKHIGSQIYGILMIIFLVVILVSVILIATVQFRNTLSGINGANTNVGTTGQTTLNFFDTLVSNYSTLVSFVGIVILLLLVGLLFVALGGMNWLEGAFGGKRGRESSGV